MTLPAPVLDDRRFQDIVDEAKRLIPRFCPDWTDHNVADPGVALLELFAWMSEMIIYRLNQVPDRLYLKFLELVGVELFPPSSAQADITFALAGPARETTRVPAGTQVATDGSVDDTVVFMTDAELSIVVPELLACLTRTSAGAFEDVYADLRTGARSATIFPQLQAGDALYLGFAEALSGNMIRIDVRASAEGSGVRPSDPPLRWQAWDGRAWVTSRVLADTSGGFNNSGSVTLLMPPLHASMPLGPTRAHWLRCRLMPPEGEQKPYDVSPQLEAVTVVSLGGEMSAHHAEPTAAELVGVSTGEPGQVFTVRRAPVLPRRANEHVRVLLPRSLVPLSENAIAGSAQAAGAGPVAMDDRWAPGHWEDWTEAADFTDAGPDDRVYLWSSANGELRFAPHIRQPATVLDDRENPHDERIDGDGVRRYGAVPPEGAQIWVTGYRYGGGRAGCVGARTLRALRTTIPAVDTVYNRDAARGGVDGETVENAKLRGPQDLRGGDRAVTVADFERLTRRAARGVARARALAPHAPGDPVRVLVVPHVDVQPELLDLQDLRLSEELERSIIEYLDERRLLTTRVVVGIPDYAGVSVAAQVSADPTVRPETVSSACELALYRHLDPLTGGFDGAGWSFGQPLTVGEVFAVLRAVDGVRSVDRVALNEADPTRPRGTGRITDKPFGDVVPMESNALFLSCDHRVVVAP